MRLETGVTCRVLKIDTTHRASKKLVEMGVVPNSVFRVEAVAPMGDPCMIRVRGYILAIRKRDLEALEVRVIKDGGES